MLHHRAPESLHQALHAEQAAAAAVPVPLEVGEHDVLRDAPAEVTLLQVGHLRVPLAQTVQGGSNWILHRKCKYCICCLSERLHSISV